MLIVCFQGPCIIFSVSKDVMHFVPGFEVHTRFAWVDTSPGHAGPSAILPFLTSPRLTLFLIEAAHLSVFFVVFDKVVETIVKVVRLLSSIIFIVKNVRKLVGVLLFASWSCTLMTRAFRSCVFREQS